jgi:chemotaxis protein methyltransferase WspC
MAHGEWLPAHPEGILQLLSLPCSSGEEPYSMAMTLLDAGFPANRFRVDALDISKRALARARSAVYGKNSFRGADLGFRDRYFEATAHGHRLSETVRQQVQFHQGNLFAAGVLPGVEIYDVIFCRNLLIYFDRPTQDRAIKVLERLLTAKGLLFVAPSETGLVLSHDFVSAKVPLAFAFRKAGVVLREAKPNPAHTVKRASARLSVALPIAPPSPMCTSLANGSAAAWLPASIDQRTELRADLEEATGLANQGRFVEAATCCEEHLRQHGPSANAFHLLGLLHDSTGNQREASDYYRKALYLDPNHYEALIHLAFLMDKQGDTAAALVLRKRARRLEQKSKT